MTAPARLAGAFLALMATEAVAAPAGDDRSPQSGTDRPSLALMHVAARIESAERPVAHVREFEKWRTLARDEGFQAIEEKLLSAYAASGGADAASALAHFYAALGLYPEAHGVIAGFSSADDYPSLLFLKGVCLTGMGRWRAAVDAFSVDEIADTPDAAAWRGLAHYRLGSYEAAFRDLFEGAGEAVPFEAEATEFFLARADVALMRGDLDRAREALLATRDRAASSEQRSMRALMEGRLILAAGETQKGIGLLSRLAEENRGAASVRAAVSVIDAQARSGDLAFAEAADRLRRLALQWRGGLTELELLAAQGAIYDRRGDRLRAVAAHRRIVERFAQADLAAASRDYIRSALAHLVDDPALAPSDAARIFYRNIEFVPPGDAGDTLIREAAEALKRLDLLQEAAELLRHQVFKRLEGVQRARVGADLAELYLDLDDPARALEALAASRRTQLPEDIEARRELVEARALMAAGDDAAALALVVERSDPEALALQGELFWRKGAYDEAGERFAASLPGEGPLDEAASSVALRAASAFILAADRERLSSMVSDLAPRIDPQSRALLNELAAEDFAREAGAFLSAHQAVFDAADGAG